MAEAEFGFWDAFKCNKDPVKQNPQRPCAEVLCGKKVNNVGHCITLGVLSMVARDSFLLRVSIGSGAILAPLLPARNPTGPPN